MSKKPATRLRSIGYLQAIKAFERAGFEFARQRGSHIVMCKAGHPANVVIPAHKPLAEGTLRGLLKAAGLTPEQFAALL